MRLFAFRRALELARVTDDSSGAGRMLGASHRRGGGFALGSGCGV